MIGEHDYMLYKSEQKVTFELTIWPCFACYPDQILTGSTSTRTLSSFFADLAMHSALTLLSSSAEAAIGATSSRLKISSSENLSIGSGTGPSRLQPSGRVKF